eukprot:3327461-Pleurochrysis_carterae.AAC.7
MPPISLRKDQPMPSSIDWTAQKCGKQDARNARARPVWSRELLVCVEDAMSAADMRASPSLPRCARAA